MGVGLDTAPILVGVAKSGVIPGVFHYPFNGFMHELIFINNRQNANDADIGWGPKQPTYEQLDALGIYLSNKWSAPWIAGVT